MLKLFALFRRSPDSGESGYEKRSVAVSGGFAVNQPGSGAVQVLEAGSKMETPPLKSLPRAPRPLRARLARWGVMLVIFMAGGVAGYSVGTMRSLDTEATARGAWSRPGDFTKNLLAKLEKDLVLTPDQTPKVYDILVRRHKKFDDLWKQTQPLFESAMGELDREMQAVLTPAQWERYKEQRARRHRHGPPGSGRGGPPGRGDGHRDDHGHGTGRDGRPPRGPKPERPDAEVPKVEPAKAEPKVEKTTDAK